MEEETKIKQEESLEVLLAAALEEADACRERLGWLQETCANDPDYREKAEWRKERLQRAKVLLEVAREII